MEIAGLNTLDLLLITFLFVGILIGLIRGAVPQIISAISIWLGLVATLWLYKPFSTFIIQDGLNVRPVVGDSIAFSILLVVFFNAFRLIVKLLTTSPEEPKKRRHKDPNDPLAEAAKTTSERLLGCVNALGGMFMGFVLTTLWLALILGVLQFIFQPTGTDIPYTGFTKGLVANMRSSVLIHQYFNKVLIGISKSVDLFIPRNADILKTVLRMILGSA